MNDTLKTKKPFGLTLACKIAAEAIHQNIAPSSTILGNLLILQKSEHFPKELDVNFFNLSKRPFTDSEKRIISNLLPDLKKPTFQIPDILEKAIKDEWVKKIPQFTPPVVQPKKVVQKKKNMKPVVKTQPQAPIIIVKKNKLI